jgi:hypothetical protein
VLEVRSFSFKEERRWDLERDPTTSAIRAPCN